METKEMIKVEKLNKSFGDLHVLKDIDLKVNESDVVCLIGSSGSGKSTLLRCLNFLEKKTMGKSSLMARKLLKRHMTSMRFAKKSEWCFSIFNYFRTKQSLKILWKHL
ncbi:ATP-binding cassette domain-containing protein [Bacillus sp. OVS6]|nr:ATP-binding cassette domain-containing protein [Bacillus sp. OVS6]